MQTTHSIQKQNLERFNPQIKDIAQAQSNLSKLKIRLKEKQISDPQGVKSRRAEELEKMYGEIKLKMKQTATNSEHAIAEMKRGFLSAWEDLRRAANQAKEIFESTPKQ